MRTRRRSRPDHAFGPPAREEPAKDCGFRVATRVSCRTIPGMETLRVRNDGSIRIHRDLLDALGIYPGSKIAVAREGDRLVIRKVVEEGDPFERAARGPDTSALERIREKQRLEKEKAKDRFEELMKNPPEVKPEDNPDLWR